MDNTELSSRGLLCSYKQACCVVCGASGTDEALTGNGLCKDCDERQA